MSRKNRQKPKSQSPAPTSGRTPADGSAPAAPAALPARAYHLVAALGLAALLIAFWRYVTLQYVYLFKDIGSDSTNWVYPLFVHASDYLRQEGLPGWSFAQGMGQNLFWEVRLADPFSLILYALGREHLAYGMAFVELAKCVCGAGVFALFLAQRGLDRTAAAVGGLLYGLSGLMILGGTWNMFSTVAVHFALLLLAFELLFRRGIWWPMPLAVALMCGYHAFNLWMFGLLLGLYVVMRCVETFGFKPRDIVLTMLKTGAFAALGAGLAAVYVSGETLAMIEAPRGSGGRRFFLGTPGGSPLPWFAPAKESVTALLRLFSDDLLGTGSQFTGWANYLEAPLFYCGLLPLILAPQAFVGATRRQKALYLAWCGLGVAIVALPWVRSAAWLLRVNYYRQLSLLVTLLFLYLGMTALSRLWTRRQLSLPLLGLTLAGWLLVLLWPYSVPGLTVGRDVAVVLACLMVFYATCLACMKDPRWTVWAGLACLLGVTAEAAWSARVTIADRPAITAAEMRGHVGYNDYTMDALARVRQDTTRFFRVNKQYGSGLAMHTSINDAMAQGFYGTASYSSFNQRSYIAFLEAVDLIKPTSETDTRWARGVRTRPLLQTLVSVKYGLVNEDNSPFLKFGFRPLAQFAEVRLLENPYFLPLGFTYDRCIRRSSFQSLPGTCKDYALLRAFVCDDTQLAAFAPFKEMPADEVSRIAWSQYMAGPYAADVAARRQHVLDLTAFSQNRIAGSIDLDSPRLLFFSIPWDRGWSARIDGSPAPLQRVNIGMMGLVLGPGKHTVELRYRPPFLRASATVSGVSLVVYGLLLGWSWRRRQRASRSAPSTLVT